MSMDFSIRFVFSTNSIRVGVHVTHNPTSTFRKYILISYRGQKFEIHGLSCVLMILLYMDLSAYSYLNIHTSTQNATGLKHFW